MTDPVNIWCGPDSPPQRQRFTDKIILNSVPDHNNVNLRIENISEKLVKQLPPLILDLLELASYVYAADQCIGRGGQTFPNNGIDWRKELVFRIPLRRLDVWNDTKVKEQLSNVLRFLSDHYFDFEFRPIAKEHYLPAYFDFDGGEPWFNADEVMLFSGGLDSLAGLCDSVRTRSGKIVLVSHRPVHQTNSIQKQLLSDFMNRTDSRNRLLHVPVWVNKDEKLTKDTHQRTRSFLFASLAASVAHMHKLKRIYFYENGITSTNLSVEASILDSRASKTTHPKALQLMARLFGIIFESDFTVENPFIWKTKADIVGTIKESGLSDLIKHSISCSHVRSGDPMSTHCGICSQCVGRRLATVYHDLGDDDPEEMYKVKMPLGAAVKDLDRAMVELIVRSGREFDRMDQEGFFQYAHQVSLVARALGKDVDEIGRKIYELHKRHGRQVCDVLEKYVENNKGLIAHGDVPSDSLLSMILPHSAQNQKQPMRCSTLDLPEGTTWESISIELISDDAIRIRAGTISKILNYAELGFKDHRKGDMPNLQWELLKAMAQCHGELTWDSPEAKKGLYKQVQRLRADLRKLFGLEGDPLKSYNKNKAYITRFTIADCRYGNR